VERWYGPTLVARHVIKRNFECLFLELNVVL
jgi:hypothetical protein